MEEKYDGGPAFPFQTFDTGNGTRIVGSMGMDLRDYFAASFVASGHVFPKLSAGNTPQEVAKQAYDLADAMLKARES